MQVPVHCGAPPGAARSQMPVQLPQQQVLAAQHDPAAAQQMPVLGGMAVPCTPERKPRGGTRTPMGAMSPCAQLSPQQRVHPTGTVAEVGSGQSPISSQVPGDSGGTMTGRRKRQWVCSRWRLLLICGWWWSTSRKLPTHDASSRQLGKYEHDEPTTIPGANGPDGSAGSFSHGSDGSDRPYQSECGLLPSRLRSHGGGGQQRNTPMGQEIPLQFCGPNFQNSQTRPALM